jgi:hypothetical protein
MPSTHFSVQTALAPNEVMAFMTDFGPTRAERWPNISPAQFAVHSQGEGWAEVTEGNKAGWERARYSWDAEAGIIAIDTLESNLWGPGSGWKYRLEATGEGTTVHVTLTRKANSLKGRLIGALIPVAGAKTLGKQFQATLRSAESSA